MKRLSYALALLGLLIALLLVSYYGFGNVVSAVSRIGWPEFGVDCRLAARAVRYPRHRLGPDHADPRHAPPLGA